MNAIDFMHNMNPLANGKPTRARDYMFGERIYVFCSNEECDFFGDEGYVF